MPPSRRHVLRFGVAALAGSLAGCTSGKLDERSDASETAGTQSTTTATAAEPTTLPTGADASLPEGSVEFPAGPKSPPARPADLTAESVREYVKTFEYRYVYNLLHYDETTEVHEECGIDSVAAYGDGFRVVVWCSAYSNTERNGSTMHADYFTQYATYLVGPDSTVRREGESETRR